MRGQSIVEFALVLPILMFLLLGFAELAMLVATRYGYQNGAEVLAQRAAFEMAEAGHAESWKAGWNAVVREEQDRIGCSSDPQVILPDGAHLAGDRVLVRWTCPYTPNLTTAFGAIDVTVESEAVVPGAPEIPSPSASPS